MQVNIISFYAPTVKIFSTMIQTFNIFFDTLLLSWTDSAEK